MRGDFIPFLCIFPIHFSLLQPSNPKGQKHLLKVHTTSQLLWGGEKKVIEKNIHTRRTRFSLSSKTTTHKIDWKEKRKVCYWFWMLEGESQSFSHPSLCRSMKLGRPEELERLVHTHTHTHTYTHKHTHFSRQKCLGKNVTRFSHLWNNWCKSSAHTTICQTTHSTTRLGLLNVLFDLLCPTDLNVMWFIIFAVYKHTL